MTLTIDAIYDGKVFLPMKPLPIAVKNHASA